MHLGGAVPPFCAVFLTKLISCHKNLLYFSQIVGADADKGPG